MMGFYIALGVAIVAGIINIMTRGKASSIVGFIEVGILYLAMKPVWKKFK